MCPNPKKQAFGSPNSLQQRSELKHNSHPESRFLSPTLIFPYVLWECSVVSCYPRVPTRGYGKTFLQAMPPCRRFVDGAAQDEEPAEEHPF